MLHNIHGVLKQRLPKKGSNKLRDINRNLIWVGDTLTHQIYKESKYLGDKSNMVSAP